MRPIITALSIVLLVAGIDCPEKGQPQAEKAKQFTSRLCFGKRIVVQESGRDRYGRTIGNVRLTNGKSLNRELIRSGYAWVYRQYSSDPKLLQLELAAKTKRRGLWKDPQPIAPWVFRRSSAKEN